MKKRKHVSVEAKLAITIVSEENFDTTPNFTGKYLNLAFTGGPNIFLYTKNYLE
jgi:hypothetical protein